MTNSITWYGQVFDLGSALINNVVKATGQTITLPVGYATNLLLLGSATNGVQSSETFRVNYTNGTYSTFTQTFSDWVTGYTGTGGSTAPGESIAASLSHYNYWNGSTSSQINVTSYVYGYDFAVNSADMVASITFPNDSNVKILAIDEIYNNADYEPSVVKTGNQPVAQQSGAGGQSASSTAGSSQALAISSLAQGNGLSVSSLGVVGQATSQPIEDPVTVKVVVAPSIIAPTSPAVTVYYSVPAELGVTPGSSNSPGYSAGSLLPDPTNKTIARKRP